MHGDMGGSDSLEEVQFGVEIGLVGREGPSTS